MAIVAQCLLAFYLVASAAALTAVAMLLGLHVRLCLLGVTTTDYNAFMQKHRLPWYVCWRKRENEQMIPMIEVSHPTFRHSSASSVPPNVHVSRSFPVRVLAAAKRSASRIWISLGGIVHRRTHSQIPTSPV
ncbi:hypothetical protein FBU59_003686 [Linderina macrospora]|uniref:Uncharacterized protein n=1 Tax=Linderina macrospora TaxID=4868 RepID=A0ACC1J7I7_9FUNG|nr:hypothetical protein FBU59_003686 [Linderina macrospora]